MLKGVSETLYIPLYGRASARKYGNIIEDPMAERIVRESGYDFDKNTRSRFLDIYMAIRAAAIDRLVAGFLERNPGALVVHMGCGLDSRELRVKGASMWVDVDLPEVIRSRAAFFKENDGYCMLSADGRQPGWLDRIIAPPSVSVAVVSEGLSMYLSHEENIALMKGLRQRFGRCEYIFDAYSESAVKWSKLKNPVNKMGAVIKWGLDGPEAIERQLPFARCAGVFYFTGREWSDRLYKPCDRALFRLFYGNSWANGLYRLYRFELEDK